MLPVYRAWRERGNAPDFALLNTLIDCCAKSRMPQQALELFNEMRALKFEPSEVTYSLMMKACGAKMLRAAMQYYALAKQTGLANAGTYTLAMRIASSAGDTARVHAIYSDMLAAGCEPTNASFAILIQTCGRSRDEGKMRELFDSMKDFGLRPNEEVYTVRAPDTHIRVLFIHATPTRAQHNAHTKKHGRTHTQIRTRVL